MTVNRERFWPTLARSGYKRREGGHGRPVARSACLGSRRGLGDLGVPAGSAGIAVAGG